jgi:FkbM family methyltransferase
MIKFKECRHGPMLFPVNDKWTGRSFDLYGEAYEPQISLMLKFINPGDVVIDAGANIGAMTIPLAKAVGDAGRVIAFEPQEFLYYVLCGNIAANNLYNVKAYNKAVGDVTGQTMYCPSQRLKNKDDVPFYDDELQHFGGVYLTPEPRFDTDNEIGTMAIDDLELDRADFLKIDIEGDELKALEGALETIERFKPLMFIESMPWSLPKIAEALRKLKYTFRSCRMCFFNPRNFFNNAVDVLREDHAPEIPMMSSDIICYHMSQTTVLDFKYFKAIKEINEEFSLGYSPCDRS